MKKSSQHPLPQGCRRQCVKLGRLGVLFLALLAGPMPMAHAESWDEVFKGMARDLVEDLVEKGAQEVQGGSADDAPRPDPSSVGEQAQPVVPAKPSPADAGNNLHRSQLRRVQLDLRRLGYDPGPADGLMGRKTTQAIMAFERDRDLPVTGRLSPRVIQGIQAALQQRRLSQGEGAQAGPVGSDFDTADVGRDCKFTAAQCAEEISRRSVSPREAYAANEWGRTCMEQAALCRKQSAEPLTAAQIDLEVQDLESSCRHQSVQSRLYDCACVADAYRSYRRQRLGERIYRHGQRPEYERAFYDTDWASKCYESAGAYEQAYSSCMNMYPMSSRARHKSAAEIEATCKCYGNEFAALQRAESGLNSRRVNAVQAEAYRRCY